MPGSPALLGAMPEESPISFVDTSFMLANTGLVLLMTPGLAFFYGGLVRRKNVLSILVQCFVCMCLNTLLWVIVGFSLAFGDSLGGFIGNPWTYFMLRNVTSSTPWPNTKIPMQVFMIYQCMFAIITPALILGAYAERIRFRGFCVFTMLWLLLCYTPVCHWAWGGGLFHGSSGAFLMRAGEDSIDFAGGSVVHINSAVAALVSSMVLGRRQGDLQNFAPHNLPLAVMGAALLWFGWFGFNAGSELAADSRAVSAFTATHEAAAAAGVMWCALDLLRLRRVTVLGTISGCVAGLVAITPACGDVETPGALILGFGGSVVSYFMVMVFKEKCGYDDSLDVFGIHGGAGIWGGLAVGFLSVQTHTDGTRVAGWLQVWVQLKSILVTLVYSAVVSLVLAKAVDRAVGMRADPQKELLGLDAAYHGEQAYSDGDDGESGSEDSLRTNEVV